MSKQNQGEDFSFTGMVLLIVGLLILMWAIDKYAPIILLPWKYLRAAELALTLQLDMLPKVLAYDFQSYGRAFDAVNDRMAIVFRVIAFLVGIHAFHFFCNYSKPEWSMEQYLDSIYNRFKWLSIVYKPPTGLSFKKQWPFIELRLKYDFPETHFPTGVEPLEYFHKHEAVLPEKLKEQLDPLIKIKDKKIQWQDNYAKMVALECLRRIPDKKPEPGAKSWRDAAWHRCLQNHRYERTFAMGMLQAARDFGVLSAIEMLHIRKEAGLELKKGRPGAFYLWRAMISLGGRSVYPEGAGIICHYYYEKALTDHLVTHPQDAEIVQNMRSKPWVMNAVTSFTDVRDTVMNSPDVLALKKAGLYKG